MEPVVIHDTSGMAVLLVVHRRPCDLVRIRFGCLDLLWTPMRREVALSRKLQMATNTQTCHDSGQAGDLHQLRLRVAMLLKSARRSTLHTVRFDMFHSQHDI